MQVYTPKSAVACCHCDEIITLSLIPDHLHACPILDVSNVQLGTVEEADRSQDMNDRGIAADQRVDNQPTLTLSSDESWDVSSSNPLTIAGDTINDQLESSPIARNQGQDATLMPSQSSLESHGMLTVKTSFSCIKWLKLQRFS